MKYRYHVTINSFQNSESKINQTITRVMCTRKIKRFIRYIMKFKDHNYALNFISVYKCDADGNMLPGCVKFIKNKKDIQ